MRPSALGDIRRRWRHRDARLYRLTTAHGTGLVLPPDRDLLFHAHTGSPLDAACLLVLDADTAFLMRAVAVEGTAQWWPTTVAIRAQVADDRRTCTLRHPVTATYYGAEPLPAGHAAFYAAMHRREAGAWETFGLVPCGLPRALARSRGYRDLLRLVARSPGLADLLSRAGDGRSDVSLRAVRAYAACRYGRDDVLSVEFDAFEPGLKVLAESRDPWMWPGLPDLARWAADRSDAPRTRGIGPDLDCIADGYLGPQTLGRTWASAKRGRVVPRRGACLVASARNEGPYLLEWVAYHRAIGFEEIVLYSNGNDDGSDDLLRALAGAGLITWIDNALGPAGLPQQKSYGHALGLDPAVLDFAWALIIDLDEYLVLDTARFPNVAAYLAWQAHREVDAIALNWCVFGTFGIARSAPDVLLTRRFVERFASIDAHVKTCFRPQRFDHAHCHYPFAMLGQAVVFRDSEGEAYAPRDEFALSAYPRARTAWINHYVSKSLDDMMWKCWRGVGDKVAAAARDPAEIAATIAGRTLLAERGAATTIDGRAIAAVPSLEAHVAALMRSPDVSRAAARIRTIFETRVAAIRTAILGLDSRDVAPEIRALIALLRD